MSKQIVVHVGLGKTGTSAIQALLARNAEKLRTFGVDYPFEDSFARASEGKISSGNRESFYRFSSSQSDTVLFSNEGFSLRFEEGTEFMDKLRSISEPIKIICFTRDLFGHFASVYGQYIKRGGGTSLAGEFAGRYKIYHKVLRMIELCDALGFELVLRNYSRCQANLEHEFMRIVLGERAAQFMAEAVPNSHIINRSLTLAEYEVQRLFNQYFGKASSQFVSDKFVELAPEISSEQPAIDRSAYERVLEMNAEVIHQINTRLPAGEEIQLEAEAIEAADHTPGDASYTLSARQLEILVKSVSEQLLGQRIHEPEIVLLRDVALKYESATTPSRQEALGLMKMALRARPDGPLIKQKVQEWSK